MTSIEIKKEFLSLFKELSRSSRAWSVWYDFVSMSAYAISNQYHYEKFKERESKYMEIISKYKDSAYICNFGKMLALCFLHYKDFGFEHDFLGEMYMELELGNEQAGQFFTPMCITRLMANLQVSGAKNRVEQKGIVTVSDPACGAGAMLLAAIEAMIQEGVSIGDVYAEGWDIDHVAVCMSYIQLSATGVAARIVHGNSISLQMYDVWYTPEYITGRYDKRLVAANEVQLEHVETECISPDVMGLEAIWSQLYS